MHAPLCVCVCVHMRGARCVCVGLMLRGAMGRKHDSLVTAAPVARRGAGGLTATVPAHWWRRLQYYWRKIIFVFDY